MIRAFFRALRGTRTFAQPGKDCVCRDPLWALHARGLWSYDLRCVKCGGRGRG